VLQLKGSREDEVKRETSATTPKLRIQLDARSPHSCPQLGAKTSKDIPPHLLNTDRGPMNLTSQTDLGSDVDSPAFALTSVAAPTALIPGYLHTIHDAAGVSHHSHSQGEIRPPSTRDLDSTFALDEARCDLFAPACHIVVPSPSLAESDPRASQAHCHKPHIPLIRSRARARRPPRPARVLEQ
jgi:hypothetical protein